MLFGFIFTGTFLLGSVGNVLLIWANTRQQQLTAPKLLLINLAVSDLLLCLLNLPFAALSILTKQWHFGSLMCKGVQFCKASHIAISSGCLGLIAVERYRSIATPEKMPWSVGRALALVAIGWVAAFVLSSPSLVLYHLESVPTGYNAVMLCGDFCVVDGWPSNMQGMLIHDIVSLIIVYLLPLTVIAFCYWRVLQKVRTDWMVEVRLSVRAEGGRTRQLRSVRNKSRVIRMLVAMVVLYTLSWAPSVVYYLLLDFEVEVQVGSINNPSLFTNPSLLSSPTSYSSLCRVSRSDQQCGTRYSTSG